MKINNLKISSYGNIKNKDINLKDGINIIYGKNESGKSTLLSFIVNNLYGISKNKDGKKTSDFERYKPWTGEDFSGKISYELDNGDSYEIYRNFNKKNAQIYNKNMEEISEKFDTNKKDGSQFFLEQVGINKETYLSTVVSMQQEVRLAEKEQIALVQKIANLAGTGDDNISYKKVVAVLDSKIKDEIGTTKTLQKPINVLERNLENTKNEIENIKKYEEKKYQIDFEKNKIAEELQKNGMKVEILSKMKNAVEKTDIKEQKKIINEENYKKNTINLETLRENNKNYNNQEIELQKVISQKENEKQNLQDSLNKIEMQVGQRAELENIINKNKANKKIQIATIWVFVILLIIAEISKYILKNTVLSISLLVVSIISLLTNIYIAIKTKKDSEANRNKQLENNKILKQKEEILTNIEKIEKEINTEQEKLDVLKNKNSMIKGQIALLNENNEKINETIKLLNDELEVELSQEQEKIKKEYFGRINNEKLEEIINSNDIIKNLEESQKEQEEGKLKLKTLEIEEKNVLPQLDKLVELEEKKEAMEDEHSALKNKEKVINTAIKYLTIAYEEMKTTITPKFTQELSNSISEISNNKYNKVTINDEKGILVENQRGEYIEADKLSVGTIDQLYLSLRLSMIDELSNEKLPVLLDESFAYFDNDRLKNILIYLNEKLNKHQAIIFTCTNRETKILDEINIKYNLVNI